MARYLCPTSTGVFHDWSDDSVELDSAIPALRLCPDHDCPEREELLETIGETPEDPYNETEEENQD